MSLPPVVALDVGSTKVACVVAMPYESQPGYDILGSSLPAYPSGLPTWPHDPLMIGRTIEQAVQAAGFGAEAVDAQVAMSHPALRSETVQTAIALADEPITVRGKDLKRLTRAALNQALGVDREALVVERLGCSGNGFEGVRDPQGLSATRLLGTFHIVTVPIAVRRALVQAVESAGLEVAQLTYSLQADAAANEETREAKRLLLIDIGGLNIDVGLFVQGHLQASRTVPWGGLTLAFAIAKELRMTLEQATTLSLEGLGSRRPQVREQVKNRLAKLQRAIHEVLKGEPLPERAVVTGRGALIDGLVEWVERVTEIKTSINRSTRLQSMGNLSRQVGLSTALGLLELATASHLAPATHPPRLFDRVISRTKTLLTEYF